MRSRTLFPICLGGWLLCLTACAKQAYYIDTYANRDEVGNYVIKWDVRPGMEGRVELFVSDDPYNYPTRPFATESIGKQVATYVTKDNFSRKFFMLLFDRTEMVVTGARVIPTFSVSNLRDVGGYQTIGGQYVRWGMLYRSGRLTKLSYRDSVMIDRLGIRSRIVLADTPGGVSGGFYPDDLASSTLMADEDQNQTEILRKILKGEIDAQGVQKYRVENLKRLAYHNVKQYKAAFEQLLVTKHYPILVSDTWGKDRVAFFMMLVQSVLNMNRGDILNDYLVSNQLLQVERLVPGGYALSPSMQEALTEFFRCKSNDLNQIMTDIERRYGSIPKYMEKVYGFGASQQARLRSILLD